MERDRRRERERDKEIYTPTRKFVEIMRKPVVEVSTNVEVKKKKKKSAKEK